MPVLGSTGNFRYTVDFERRLLESTESYYTRTSEEWIEGDGTPAYMVKAEAALEAEKARVAHYLNSSSEQAMLGVVETEILEKREMALLDKEGSGLRVLLANDKVRALPTARSWHPLPLLTRYPFAFAHQTSTRTCRACSNCSTRRTSGCCPFLQS